MGRASRSWGAVAAAITLLSGCSIKINRAVTISGDGPGTGIEATGIDGTGPSPTTTLWPFSTAGDYAYDPSRIQVFGGKASLIQKSQSDQDNTSAGWGTATLTDVSWDGSGFGLNAGSATGSAVSRIMDAGAPVWWNSLEWTPDRPYGKELPDYTQSESLYSAGNANMAGNVLLLHLNETSGTTFADASGAGNIVTCSSCPTLGAVGKLSNAVTLNGTTDTIDLGTGSSLNFAAGVAFTVAGWVKTTENYGTIVSFRKSGNQTPVIDIQVGTNYASFDAKKIMSLVRDQNSQLSNITGPAIADGAWHLFALTRSSAGTVTLYVDGVSAGTGNGVAVPGAISTDMRAIGSERYWINAGNGLPSFSVSPANNRYFQYKVTFESDDNAYRPRLSRIAIGPQHYDAGSPSISNSAGVVIDANIATFPDIAGIGSFYFKAFLNSTGGTQAVELDQVGLTSSAQ